MQYRFALLRRRLWALLLLAVASISASGHPPGGYRLRVKINGFSGPSLLLAYQLGSKSYIQDTAQIGTDGVYEFAGNQPLPPGIYLVAIPPNNDYFELLIDQQNQQFSLETSRTDLVKQMRITGSADNVAFYQYFNFLAPKKLNADAFRNILQRKSPGSDTVFAKTQLEKIEKAVSEHQQMLATQYKGTLFGKVIRSQLPAENNLPSFGGSAEEQDLKRYQWARARWFDHLNPGDPFFMRTSLLMPRITAYLDDMTVQHPDSVVLAVDDILRRCLPHESDPFQYLLIELLNKYANHKTVGMDKVYVHIAEQYYKNGKALKSDAATIKRIVDQATSLKPIVVGAKAPALQVSTIDGKPFDLHRFQANYTVLYFWSTSMARPADDLTSLLHVANKYKNNGVGIVTVASGRESNLSNLVNIVITSPQAKAMTCTIDTQPASSGSARYFLRSYPQLFVLDADKRIVSKQISVEQLPGVLDQLLNLQ